MINEPTHTASPQELIICKINSEEDSIILAFMYRGPNSSNENSEYFNITLKSLSDKFLSNLLVIGDFISCSLVIFSNCFLVRMLLPAIFILLKISHSLLAEKNLNSTRARRESVVVIKDII